MWQRAMELVHVCYAISRRFPFAERDGLRSQLCRAVVSIAANIAEGHGRRHRREYLQFVAIANASRCEVETHLRIAHRAGYVGSAEVERAERLCDEVGRMLTRLRMALEAAPRPRR